MVNFWCTTATSPATDVPSESSSLPSRPTNSCSSSRTTMLGAYYSLFSWLHHIITSLFLTRFLIRNKISEFETLGEECALMKSFSLRINANVAGYVNMMIPMVARAVVPSGLLKIDVHGVGIPIITMFDSSMLLCNSDDSGSGDHCWARVSWTEDRRDFLLQFHRHSGHLHGKKSSRWRQSTYALLPKSKLRRKMLPGVWTWEGMKSIIISEFRLQVHSRPVA